MGKVVYDMSDTDYHKIKEKDHYYSSSQLKDALDDIEFFHKKYITKEIVSEERDAFDTGKYFHMAMLEPQRLATDTAVWMGDKRQKAIWEKFQQDNVGKLIINARQLEEAENLIKATKGDECLIDLLYPVKADSVKTEVSIFQKFMGVNVKVRYDLMFLDEATKICYGLDLKSTTGNCKSEYKIRTTVASFNYDLSSALYVDVLNAHFAEIGSPYRMQNYYLGFASKDYCNAQAWRMSDKSLAIGRAKYMKALNSIKEAEKNNWKFKSKIIDISPMKYEEDEWLSTEGSKTGGSKFAPSPKATIASKGSKL
jgi:hypothetical protein